MGWFTRQSLSAARYHSHLFTPVDDEEAWILQSNQAIPTKSESRIFIGSYWWAPVIVHRQRLLGPAQNATRIAAIICRRNFYNSRNNIDNYLVLDFGHCNQRDYSYARYLLDTCHHRT